MRNSVSFINNAEKLEKTDGKSSGRSQETTESKDTFLEVNRGLENDSFKNSFMVVFVSNHKERT